MAEISIVVGGRSYRMACDDGQEDHLTGLGRRFDTAIDELRAGFGEVGDQRLTVMAAILMTDRLDEAEKRILELQKQVEDHRDSDKEIESLNARFAQVLHNAAGRVEQLAAALDADQREAVPDV
jgi:cell division protein ZapA